MTFTYPIYQRIAGEGGAPFMCHVFENGQSRLVFSGNTAEEAKQLAEDWVNRNFDTPERRARMAELAQKRAEAKRRKKEKEAA